MLLAGYWLETDTTEVPAMPLADTTRAETPIEPPDPSPIPTEPTPGSPPMPEPMPTPGDPGPTPPTQPRPQAVAA